MYVLNFYNASFEYPVMLEDGEAKIHRVQVNQTLKVGDLMKKLDVFGTGYYYVLITDDSCVNLSVPIQGRLIVLDKDSNINLYKSDLVNMTLEKTDPVKTHEEFLYS